MTLGLKKTIHHALELNELETVAEMAKKDRKVLSLLVRLAYDKNTLVGWRAIKAAGLTAQAIVKTDYDFLRETCRRLLWSLTDESGGIGWAAPELLGEIVSSDPDRFRDLFPIIAGAYDIEEKVFRPGVMYALGRIARVDPALIVPFKDLIERALSDEDPLVRIFALDLYKTFKNFLEISDQNNFKKIVTNMLTDSSEVWVYKQDGFVSMEVREAAKSSIG